MPHQFKSFNQYITENKKSIVIAFGRFNPPTIGHEKLMDAAAKAAGSNPYRIYPSQSSDAKKNPLGFEEKVKFMRAMFPRHARSIILNKAVRNLFDLLSSVYDDQFTSVSIICGSDRITEFQTLANKYNGEKGPHGFYNFESIKVISAGERDPDEEGATGMSASKLRAAAADDDFALFTKGLPSGYKEAKALFNAVRKGMGLKESSGQYNRRGHIQLETVSNSRELYVQGHLYNIGDSVIIKENDQIGTILVLGANYLIIETQDGLKVRKWLDAVGKIEEAGGHAAELKAKKDDEDIRKKRADLSDKKAAERKKETDDADKERDKDNYERDMANAKRKDELEKDSETANKQRDAEKKKKANDDIATQSKQKTKAENTSMEFKKIQKLLGESFNQPLYYTILKKITVYVKTGGSGYFNVFGPVDLFIGDELHNLPGGLYAITNGKSIAGIQMDNPNDDSEGQFHARRSNSTGTRDAIIRGLIAKGVLKQIHQSKATIPASYR